MNKESINECIYPDIASEIFAMAEKDQDMRKRSRENNWIIETEEDNQVDFINTDRMKEIVAEIGWPTISKVGDEGSNKAWLLVQHADHDVPFQKFCLELMKKEPANEVNPVRVGYLEDRVRVNEGRPQLYGTQFFGDGDEFGPRPIENLENVEERRAGIGMETFEEYKATMLREYKEET